MPAFRRSAVRLVAAVSIVAAVSWLAPAGFVGACSCDEQYPTVADSIGRADIAFVGSLDVSGSLEHWAVQRPPESIYDVDLVDGQLVGNGFALALPTPGSSAEGTIVTPEKTDSYLQPFTLADGRSLRFVTGEGSSSVELVAVDREPTTLQHLLEARFAVAVPDGPTADPQSVDRLLVVASVDSPWVVPDGAPALGRTSATADEEAPPPTSVSADGHLSASGDDDQLQEAAVAITDTDNSGSAGRWIPVLIAVAGLVGAGGAVLVAVNRHRRSTA